MFYEIDEVSPRDLLSLINQHKLIRIKNHGVKTAEDLLTFARKLGPLLKWPFGFINELKQNKQAENYLYSNEAVPFHWDGAFHISPHLLIFHCLKAPLAQDGGETLFVDAKKILTHFNEQEITLLRKMNLRYQTEKKAHYGGEFQIQPIQTHPITEEEILRFAEAVDTELNPVSLEITGIKITEKKSILQKLKKLLYSQELCYQHVWHDNEILIADNHGLLHGRNSFKAFSIRHIRRVQVLGV